MLDTQSCLHYREGQRMYKKILVAIDNSSLSQAIFTQALELAKAMGASLLIVHSLSDEEEGIPIPVANRLDSIYWAPGTELNLAAWEEEWNHYQSANLELLRRFAAQANGTGVATEFRQLVGTPGKVICKAAQK
ncbi:MAG TPA: universal stress protein, partial [Leptolyngbyaceae cyanobacterium M65_K2018_010]|nr:universal stress protein [Leptolyngbyaceae cyanobacterium M65_K2018_010]